MEAIHGGLTMPRFHQDYMGTEQQTEPGILYTRIEQNETAWAEITLNRPQKGNALTMPMLDQLASIVTGIEADRSLRAVVIRARGRFFCTGGDRKSTRLNSSHLGISYA